MKMPRTIPVNSTRTDRCTKAYCTNKTSWHVDVCGQCRLTKDLSDEDMRRILEKLLGDDQERNA